MAWQQDLLEEIDKPPGSKEAFINCENDVVWLKRRIGTQQLDRLCEKHKCKYIRNINVSGSYIVFYQET